MDVLEEVMTQGNDRLEDEEVVKARASSLVRDGDEHDKAKQKAN